MECPAKLYYTRKSEYANQKLDDPFLIALAEEVSKSVSWQSGITPVGMILLRSMCGNHV